MGSQKNKLSVDRGQMKNKVASPELSKKLHEAGIVVKSEFYWADKPKPFLSRASDEEMMSAAGTLTYPAPLAVELFEKLPQRVEDEYMNLYRSDFGWEMSYDGEALNGKYFTDKLLPNALAKMLLYLEENNLLPKGER